MKSSIAISKLNALAFSRMRFLSATQADTEANSNTHIYMCKERQNTEVGTEWEQKYRCSLHASARGREHICMYSGQNIDFPTSFLLHFRK